MLKVVASPGAGSRRTWRGLLAALFAASLLAAQLPWPRAVAAANGLDVTAASTYRVNTADRRLDVTVRLEMRNTKPNSGSIEYYYNAAVVYLESEATNVRATADSGTVTATVYDRGTSYDAWKISFSAAIFYGASRTLTITYQVPGGAPRSEGLTRVGAASTDFCVISNGVDAGTVQVVAPSAFTFTFTATKGTFTSATSGGATTWTSGTITDNANFWACFAGTNPAGYTTTTVRRPGGREIAVQSWPEDPTWRDAITGEVGGVVAPLEALIGRPLPGSGPLTVREVTAYSLGYYAGTFDTENGIARVSEDMDRGTVPHELSHAWFNGNLFTPRWLSEGSAGWAESSITGEACTDPGTPSTGAAANISSWAFAGPRATSAELATVKFQYAASCFVVSEVAAKAGADGTRRALAALMDRAGAYQSRVAQPTLSGKAGWREWLDAMDELGIYPAKAASLNFAQDLARRFGAVPAADVPLLAQRSEARRAYHDLVVATAWALPAPVLAAMTEWRFADARALLADAASAWGDATAAATTLPEAGVLDGPLKAQFEAAGTAADLATVARAAVDVRGAADTVAAVKARLAEPRADVTRLGLPGRDLSAALAEAVAAVRNGDIATVRARTDEITRTLGDEAAAAATVVAAKERAEAAHDPIAAIGLIGTDLAAKVSGAVAAVAAVDPAAATAAADAIDRALADAPGQGVLRIAVLLGLLALAVVLVAIRRRRRAVPAAATAVVGGMEGQDPASTTPPTSTEPTPAERPTALAAADALAAAHALADPSRAADPAPAEPDTPAAGGAGAAGGTEAPDGMQAPDGQRPA